MTGDAAQWQVADDARVTVPLAVMELVRRNGICASRSCRAALRIARAGRGTKRIARERWS